MKNILLTLSTGIITTIPIISTISCSVEITKEDAVDSEVDTDTTLLKFDYEGSDYGYFDYAFGIPLPDKIDALNFDKYILAMEEMYVEVNKNITTKYIDVEARQFVGSDYNELIISAKRIELDRLPLVAQKILTNGEISDINDFWEMPHLDMAVEWELHKQMEAGLKSKGAKEMFSNEVYAISRFLETVASYNEEFDKKILTMDFTPSDSSSWNKVGENDFGPLYETILISKSELDDKNKTKIMDTFGADGAGVDKLFTLLREQEEFSFVRLIGYEKSNDIKIRVEFPGGTAYSSFLSRGNV